MSFSFASVLAGLQQGLQIVEQLSTAAAAVGAPTGMIATVAKIGGALLETAQNVQARVADGTVAATSQDQDELKAVLAPARR